MGRSGWMGTRLEAGASRCRPTDQYLNLQVGALFLKRGLFIRLWPETPREPWRLVLARWITLRAGHPGAAASASVRAIPRFVRIVLADPAAVLAQQTRHRRAPSPFWHTKAKNRRVSTSPFPIDVQRFGNGTLQQRYRSGTLLLCM
jgi:hypothetical protein